MDILSRNTTWSMARELDYDLYFPAVAYYDGVGFMVPRSTWTGSPAEENVLERFRMLSTMNGAGRN